LCPEINTIWYIEISYTYFLIDFFVVCAGVVVCAVIIICAGVVVLVTGIGFIVDVAIEKFWKLVIFKQTVHFFR